MAMVHHRSRFALRSEFGSAAGAAIFNPLDLSVPKFLSYAIYSLESIFLLEAIATASLNPFPGILYLAFFTCASAGFVIVIL